jgi:agmatinase
VFNQKNVVGFDLVELCPDGVNKQSEFLAAKLYYKMLSYKFNDEEAPLEGEDIEGESPFSKLNKFKEDEDYD